MSPLRQPSEVVFLAASRARVSAGHPCGRLHCNDIHNRLRNGKIGANSIAMHINGECNEPAKFPGTLK